MKQYDDQLDRRTFVRAGLAAAVVAGTAARTPGDRVTNGEIATRLFGKTGLHLPILGMGSSAMVAAWSRGYGSKPGTVEERAKLVRQAYDRGVRYFDTARSYYDAEEVIGLGLKGVGQNCVIASKVTVVRPDRVRPSVEKSLEVLGVDRVTIMQIHSSGAIERGGFDASLRIHAELVKLRDEGLFRFIGLTTHVAFKTVARLIDTEGFDQALLAYCYLNKGMDTLLSKENLAARERCLDRSKDLGMGVAAMKVMGVSVFGRMSKYTVPGYDPEGLTRLPAAAMRWALSDERISLLDIGMGYPEVVDRNAETLSSDLTLTEADRDLLADYAARVYETPRYQSMRVV